MAPRRGSEGLGILPAGGRHQVGIAAWQKCVDHLQEELSSQQFNTWIRPLQAVGGPADLRLLAPNRYVKDHVSQLFLNRIVELMNSFGTDGRPPVVVLEVGAVMETEQGVAEVKAKPDSPFHQPVELNEAFTFDAFVEGKSNELAKAAARQVAENAGKSYNPLLLYGGVGLGKTHLMQAVGHSILSKHPGATVIYLHSQRFVQDMVTALQKGTMREFMDYYRSVDALLIDDIQFFANKLTSQENFFHVFNSLLERGQQMVLTCDRYPREIDGLEERLKSRFVWGLTVAVEPPELETRVAILMKKAELDGVALSSDVAFFIAERVRSNVRELEGVLKRVIAHARFAGSPITIDQVKQSLRDLLAMQERHVSIDNIQRAVADYYKIKLSDLLSKRRNRTIARPRQMAMCLAKQLTSHSLPEIGEAFGGRDHTTVLHACRKIAELREGSADVAEDHKNLIRVLTG